MSIKTKAVQNRKYQNLNSVSSSAVCKLIFFFFPPQVVTEYQCLDGKVPSNLENTNPCIHTHIQYVGPIHMQVGPIHIYVCVYTHTDTPHIWSSIPTSLITTVTVINFPRRKRTGLSSAVSNHHYLYKVILHFICTRDDNQVRTFPHKNFSRRKNVLNVERLSQRKVQGI